MTQKHSIWLALCHCWVGVVKRFPILLAILLGGGVLLLPGCGGQHGLAPVTKHARSTPSRNQTVHKVRRGETLYSIAFQHGKDYRKLARLNGIRAPYTIFAGQKIRLKGSKKRVTTRPKSTKSAQVTKKTSKSTIKKSTKKLKKNKKSSKKSVKTASKKGLIKGRVSWKWPSKGMIIKKFSKKSATRKGLDISGRLGQAVKASAAGKVVYSGSGLRGYGRLIIVKHNERFLSAYAHNRKLLVKEGQVVKQGQRIAEMGRSGTDRVKLHFEIRSDGNPVDPLRYLPKRQG